MRDEVLQFFSTARGCSYDVINIPLVELRNEPCIGVQDALFHVSYEEACVVRAHSTTHGYPNAVQYGCFLCINAFSVMFKFYSSNLLLQISV